MADLDVAVVDVEFTLGAAARVGTAAGGDGDLALGAGDLLADFVGGDFGVLVVPLVEFAPGGGDGVLVFGVC